MGAKDAGDGARFLEGARTYLDALCADHLEFVLFTEVLRLGRADVACAGDAGVALQLHATGSYLIAAVDVAGARAVMEALPPAEGKRTFMFTDERAAIELGFDAGHREPYYIYVYKHETPLPLRDTIKIERLGPEHAAFLGAHYALLPAEDIERHLADGWVWGGYNEQGELVGFIGEHDEGSLGMLEVLPEHRRRGYAHDLEAALVNRMLEAGRVPFGQVAVDNEASKALQETLKMTRAETVNCWCWE